jgi:hypothetical protein
MPHVLVWDIETVPDLRGFAAANGLDGQSDDDVRAAICDKFPKDKAGAVTSADLAGADVAVIDLIPVVNEPRHFARAPKAAPVQYGGPVPDALQGWIMLRVVVSQGDLKGEHAP